MGHTTDELLALAARSPSNPQPRELDMLLTRGADLDSRPLDAITTQGASGLVTGSQAGIVT